MLLHLKIWGKTQLDTGKGSYLHSVQKREIPSHRKIFFPKLPLFDTSIEKMLLSRKFCQKSVRENFCNFQTVTHEQCFASWDEETDGKLL